MNGNPQQFRPPLRPTLKDHPARRRARLRCLAALAAVLATFGVATPVAAFAMDLPGAALPAVGVFLQIKAALVGVLLLRARKQSFELDGQLSMRDIDALVAYAHHLSIADLARAEVRGRADELLTYRAIDGFVDWMEEQGRAVTRLPLRSSPARLAC